ncbi:hypothetical protein HDV05_000942 [Chytridiales sp. JEL 0842]|nr:hypothetical protein HDV05_000942 [Chytridiales sp. JEL 0842]
MPTTTTTAFANSFIPIHPPPNTQANNSQSFKESKEGVIPQLLSSNFKPTAGNMLSLSGRRYSDNNNHVSNGGAGGQKMGYGGQQQQGKISSLKTGSLDRSGVGSLVGRVGGGGESRREAVEVKKDVVAQGKGGVVEIDKKEVVELKREVVEPKKEVIKPKKEAVEPKKDIVEPKKGVIERKKEVVEPKKEVILEKKEVMESEIEIAAATAAAAETTDTEKEPTRDVETKSTSEPPTLANRNSEIPREVVMSYISQLALQADSELLSSISRDLELGLGKTSPPGALQQDTEEAPTLPPKDDPPPSPSFSFAPSNFAAEQDEFSSTETLPPPPPLVPISGGKVVPKKAMKLMGLPTTSLSAEGMPLKALKLMGLDNKNSENTNASPTSSLSPTEQSVPKAAAAPSQKALKLMGLNSPPPSTPSSPNPPPSFPPPPSTTQQTTTTPLSKAAKLLDLDAPTAQLLSTTQGGTSGKALKLMGLTTPPASQQKPQLKRSQTAVVQGTSTSKKEKGGVQLGSLGSRVLYSDYIHFKPVLEGKSSGGVLGGVVMGGRWKKYYGAVVKGRVYLFESNEAHEFSVDSLPLEMETSIKIQSSMNPTKKNVLEVSTQLSSTEATTSTRTWNFQLDEMEAKIWARMLRSGCGAPTKPVSTSSSPASSSLLYATPTESNHSSSPSGTDAHYSTFFSSPTTTTHPSQRFKEDEADEEEPHIASPPVSSPLQTSSTRTSSIYTPREFTLHERPSAPSPVTPHPHLTSPPITPGQHGMAMVSPYQVFDPVSLLGFPGSPNQAMDFSGLDYASTQLQLQLSIQAQIAQLQHLQRLQELQQSMALMQQQQQQQGVGFRTNSNKDL